MRTLIVFLLLVSIVVADEYPFDATLYDAQKITARLSVNSSVTLTGSGKGDKLEATVHYIPEDAGEIVADPQPSRTAPLVFTWDEPKAGSYPFAYTTTVETQALHPRITEAIPYPFNSPASVTQFLQHQEITNTNDEIHDKTQRLIAGKTDALSVVFVLAQWVENNIEYDLNTVTSQASKESTWVYENREGVCDELTSLFITMSREAGIPARFVSGIAYTNLEEYDNWGPHGWAEVWLPEVGWVPVDVTYRQIGYVDATHIVITRSLDSKNTAVDYSLYASNLAMTAQQLQVETDILRKDGDTSEPLDIRLDALYKEVGSESGNLITATITNNANYYIATELYLVPTEGTKVPESMNQQVLLAPGATQKLSWRVTMPEFDEGYDYTVPFTVIAQRAENASTIVKGNTRFRTYPLPPIASTEISTFVVACDEPKILYPGESTVVQCTSNKASICTNTCSDNVHTIEYIARAPGAETILVQAYQGKKTSTAVLTFITEERPSPSITANVASSAQVQDTLTLGIDVVTTKLENATVHVTGAEVNHAWNSSQLENKHFELRFPATYLDAGDNALTITVEGLDKNGELIIANAQADVRLEASFIERIQLILAHLFL
jgi:transglutaminase-like putative cysteine protease